MTRNTTRDTARDTGTDQAPALPFARPWAVSGLSRRHETPFRIEADAGEREALARFLDVARVEELSLEGVIAPSGAEGWEIRGRLVAALEQTCVVSLEPVAVRHDTAVERQYLPADLLAPVHEVTVEPDEEDEPDPFSNSLDPARLALESLALMLDPYPRAPGAKLGEARFAPPGVKPLEDEELRPFAGLAELKRRLERGDS